MKRLLIAVVLVGLVVNPALHWCCVATRASSGGPAMPSCHSIGDAATRVGGDPSCHHDWPQALTSEASTLVDAPLVADTPRLASWWGRPRTADPREHPSDPDASPPHARAVPLRI